MLYCLLKEDRVLVFKKTEVFYNGKNQHGHMLYCLLKEDRVLVFKKTEVFYNGKNQHE